jgi:cytochrome P450
MIFYFLHSNPSAYQSLLEELDKTFDLASPGEIIRKNPHIINKLTYTTAIIRETLRLFPPGNTVRVGSTELNITADV